MSIYVNDAGSRYIVKYERLKEAYAWLEHEGEFAHVVGSGDGVIYLGADGYDDMFCGDTCCGFAEYVAKFMDWFCENGSYACFYCNDYDDEYTLVWKEDGLVQEETVVLGNPFTDKIAQLEG